MFENIYMYILISIVFTMIVSIAVGYISYERGQARGYSNGVKNARINKRAELRNKDSLERTVTNVHISRYPDNVSTVSKN